MKWLRFDSLRKRYAVLTILLGIIMLGFSSYEQKQISLVKKDIQKNIESRNKLLLLNHEIQNATIETRELLFRFLIDPKDSPDEKLISESIFNTIHHIVKLSLHPWIKKNYDPTINELILTLKELDKISKKIIKVRLNPQLLFPVFKIANLTMQPLYAETIENLQLAIIETEDNHTQENRKEHQQLIEIRFYWITMVSDFRMYLLNKLNAFRESSSSHQLNLITELQGIIKNKIKKLNQSDKNGKLSFTTSIALEHINTSSNKWLDEFKIISKINKSKVWRADTIIYQQELGPKLNKINNLLRVLSSGIEKFSKDDLITLTKTSQLQVDSIWTATGVSLLVLLLGFIFLVKLILNPITVVTKALKDESKGINTSIESNISVLETKNLISAFKEMRHQIHSRQQELEYHALHDSLTGLANRKLLIDRLEQSIHNAKQEQSSFSILIMDLDQFKEVNDTLGHSVGDKLLQQVANRLVYLLREVDIIVRLGGDEFAVLLTTAQENHASLIAKKILNEFNNVFTVNNTPLYIGISIGISVFPQHGMTAQILQQRADVAMYVAKRNKSGFEIYNQKYDEYSVGKLSLISDLRNALDQNQFIMEYQPVINIKTGAVISAEALLRWNHPVRGKVFPDDIIPAAEQTGLINPITYWIIDTTAKYNKKLKSQGIDIKIAINLSVYNLQDENFVENIIAIFNKNEIPASNFIMEITESVMMTNPKKSIDVLNRLDELGIEIAVDDFGTGYSSLAYLKRLPLSKLKIDKSFIMDMIDDDNDAMIVRSTIDLAHNLGMQVIAEGIEEEEMLNLLDILRCDFGQGYFISRPISADNFEQWIIQQNNHVRS